ncbi:MAG TPA: class I SAM-dependent methyltransferase [Terriglobales bacterium]|nr:class I SAM-dependent methyltransferase [Terriglobales bacterium]
MSNPGTPSSPARAYDPFAAVYHRDIAGHFYRKAFLAIEKLLLSKIPRGGAVLDLCCGSGEMARELSARGYRVVGLDGSPEMAKIARANAPQAKFFVADAKCFSAAPVFDAVLSSFNSLAHAHDANELRLILQNAKAALKPHGILLFDLSMEEQYAAKWRGSFGEVHEDVSWIVRASFNADARLARNDITLFRKNGTSWKREDFSFSQTCHSRTEVENAALANGFSHIESFDAEKDLGIEKEGGRRFFRCQ